MIEVNLGEQKRKAVDKNSNSQIIALIYVSAFG